MPLFGKTQFFRSIHDLPPDAGTEIAFAGRSNAGKSSAIMDARHLFSVLDRQLLEWAAPLKKPAHVLLTKADKLSKQQAMTTLREAQSLARHHPSCGIQLFSAASGTGVAAGRKVIAQWLNQQ